MLHSICRIHILVYLTFSLFFFGALYVFIGYSNSFVSIFQLGNLPKTKDDAIISSAQINQNASLKDYVLKEDVVTRDGVNNCGRWSIEELKMQAGLKYAQPSTQKGRTDVNSVTNWNVPLVWEGTFDPVVIDAIYKTMHPGVAVVVFAIGKYTRFLEAFLESGEKYFLVDFRVTYYVFTDNKQKVPQVKLGSNRKISVITVPGAQRWQEVVLGRMKWATIAIENQIRNEADYLFMMDIDSVFHNRFGAESLSRLSAVLHRGYYKNTHRDKFPYERRPQSTAYIPAGEGDYYYTAAVWGGYLEDMYKLVKHCYAQAEEDSKKNIEAVWQEESHLNKYLLYNKPTKVLSPEYLWSDYDKVPADIKVVRISQLVKDYKEVRPNGGH
ncbi:globoside alpha-1,3-N-acetylgalactosaminyltransferase 1-like isoform X1 [Phycodurus eques]|uniref:globoside alpha-1,3-N-acetylgalactosaminyltransferase 1-like isoform X1 n=1 Tax=Phycodurus eques TaxID=693459 RepID=UPI002ACE7E8A|nr:globoside alpha-1,3-N-acetylgalactosaminyltransferase 1-like isoform X1 [Phycodurus eques]